jgi:hypothetical protein
MERKGKILKEIEVKMRRGLNMRKNMSRKGCSWEKGS